MTLSKAEKILSLLNQWDPEGRYANGAGYRAYNYEAETIALAVRKNSRPQKVEELIIDAFSPKELNEQEVKQIAEYIVAMLR